MMPLCLVMRRWCVTRMSFSISNARPHWIRFTSISRISASTTAADTGTGDTCGPTKATSAESVPLRRPSLLEDHLGSSEVANEGSVVLRRTGYQATRALGYHSEAFGKHRLQADHLAPDEVLRTF